ncbi:MAG: hypothetical protein ACK5Z5_01660 [Neisseriaceae bacterium]
MFMYYLEILGTIILFMFLGLFFSPFVGGCFGLLFILLILSGVIVFFSINFIWFLLLGLILYSFGWIIKYYRWHKLPTLDKYLENSPHSKLVSGIACCNCNSDSIINYGLLSQNSRFRYYVCKSCGHTLYRFTVL